MLSLNNHLINSFLNDDDKEVYVDRVDQDKTVKNVQSDP